MRKINIELELSEVVKLINICDLAIARDIHEKNSATSDIDPDICRLFGTGNVKINEDSFDKSIEEIIAIKNKLKNCVTE